MQIMLTNNVLNLWINMKFKRINFKSAATLIAAVLGTLLLFLSSTQAVADMFSLFKKYDVHLSPEVHGQITLEGKPLSNIEILRGLTYGDDGELIDKATTDEQGRFYFPEKNIRSRKPGSMFDESRIRQIISLDYNKEKYLLWYTAPIGVKTNKALTERLKKLNCDLSNIEEEVEFDSPEYPQSGHLVHSICRW